MAEKNSQGTKKPQNKYRAEPSKKTSWAYWMQAIEPTSEAINNAFPDYHPQWVQLSQKVPQSPEGFALMRVALRMTQKQCAAFLRVGESTIRKWECGSSPVPFAEFELLRLILESGRSRMAHPDWDGWFIDSNGKLVSPNFRLSFTPADLDLVWLNNNSLSCLRGEAKRLQDELNDAIAENTRLRQMFLSQGVVDELVSMQERLNALVACVATAHVIPFTPATEDHEVKAA